MNKVPHKNIVIDFEDLKIALDSNRHDFVEKLTEFRKDGFKILINIPNIYSISERKEKANFISYLEDASHISDGFSISGPNQSPYALHLDDKAITNEEFLNKGINEIKGIIELS